METIEFKYGSEGNFKTTIKLSTIEETLTLLEMNYKEDIDQFWFKNSN